MNHSQAFSVNVNRNLREAVDVCNSMRLVMRSRESFPKDQAKMSPSLINAAHWKNSRVIPSAFEDCRSFPVYQN